ncbi:DUF5336 domain-containing protein [Mycolicibacterium smegmatis]|jgi:hypothetical protein|uniref:DUF5336 domain-containing protein n=1 Tax=Mycolicibacterium smegmatis TaxID=1772 RepID=UPI001E31C5B3|nr:DUF5336 domain-containing protein [Mycolicibacterium smegmatis]UGU34337.1 DUF5336 domain-containing protein [Mycolicibacterium smegmatis]ULN69172.1 DUF5336 domain-containing protein [Mycolicibacterium smegmatis]
MTYPPSSPGYPPAPQSGSQYGATQPFGKPAETAPAGESSLPQILLGVAAAAGLIAYFVSYGIEDAQFAVGAPIVQVIVVAALAGALLAGVSLLPKQKNHAGVASVLALVAFLQSVYLVILAGSDSGWAFITILVLTLIQAGAALTVLLFDSGILTPPPPKPAYEQQPQYGQYGAPSQYYGQQPGQQHGQQPGQHGQQPGQQQGQPSYQQGQRPGYPSQYGGYSAGPSTGGFPTPGSQPGGQQHGQQSGPPTPPTGFPTYGQPQQSSGPSSAPTSQVPAQPQQQQPGQQPSSPQSGQSSS